jgi:hypothetical protein
MSTKPSDGPGMTALIRRSVLINRTRSIRRSLGRPTECRASVAESRLFFSLLFADGKAWEMTCEGFLQNSMS